MAGVRDVLAKSLGSPNPINTAWVTVDCLKNLRLAEDVCRLRGKSLEELVPWLAKKRQEESVAFAEVETVEEIEEAAIEGREEEA